MRDTKISIIEHIIIGEKMVAVRKEVMEEFLKENAEKVNKIKSIKDLASLLYEWCKKRGYKVYIINDEIDENDIIDTIAEWIFEYVVMCNGRESEFDLSLRIARSTDDERRQKLLDIVYHVSEDIQKSGEKILDEIVRLCRKEAKKIYKKNRKEIEKIISK